MITWPLDNTQYTAAAIGSYCACNTRGVFNQSGDFAVSCIGGFDLQVSKGLAWLKKSEYWGVSVLNEENEVLTAEIGHGQLSRTIAVTLRLDKAANSSYLTLKYSDFEGEAPVPVRDDFYDEIILAYVQQKAGASSFTTADITDTRLDENLCGVMRNALTGLDTQSIHDSAAELLDSLRQALVDVSQDAGVLASVVYDPNKRGIDITNQEYTHTAPNALLGTGCNGYFIAAFSTTQQSLFINNKEYTIKTGIEDGATLTSGVMYWFTLEGDIINIIINNNKDVYSTEETKTLGVWTNGKNIYRKVFEFTDTWNVSSYSKEIDVVFDNITTIKAIAYSGESENDYSSLRSLDYYNGIVYSTELIARNGSNCIFRFSGNMNNTTKIVLIVEYTK